MFNVLATCCTDRWGWRKKFQIQVHNETTQEKEELKYLHKQGKLRHSAENNKLVMWVTIETNEWWEIRTKGHMWLMKTN